MAQKQKNRRFGFLSDIADFSNAVVDRVGGGIVRDAIRLGGFISEPLPGQQRKAADEFIKKYAEVNTPENTSGIGNYDTTSAGGRAGRIAGTGIKAATDVVGIGKGFKAGEELGTLATQGSKAAKALSFIGGTAGALTANDIQEVGRGGPAKSTVARIPIQIGESVAEPLGLSSGEINPNGALGAVTGSEPIKSYQKQGEELANVGAEAGFIKPGQTKAAGLVLAPLLLYGDIAPGSSEEKALVKNLVKTNTEAGVKKLLNGKFDKQLLETIAPDIAKAGSKKDVRGILSRATEAAKNSEVTPGTVTEAAGEGISPSTARAITTSSAPKSEPDTNELLKTFSDLRKQHGDDKSFYENVILNNQEEPGKIGQLSRSIAREVEGKGANITDELNYQLSPIDAAAEGVQHKSAMLDDLKRTARQLERDTGQKGLYNKLAKEMSGMNEDEQIAYLSKGLTQARDSGAMAAAHIGVKPAEEGAAKGFNFLKADPNSGEGFLGDAAIKAANAEPAPPPRIGPPETITPANPESGQSVLGNIATRPNIEGQKLPEGEVRLPQFMRADPSKGESFLGDAALKSAGVTGQENLPAVPKSASETIIDALRGKKAALGVTPEEGARSIRKKQEALYSEERSRRLAIAAENAKNLTGSARYYAELSAQKGALPKLDYTGLAAQLDEPAKESLLAELQGVMDSKGIRPGTFQSIEIQTALRKVINGGNGVPTEREIKLLEQTFGGDLAKEIADDVTLHAAGLGIGRRTLNLAGQIAGVPRALMASADFSGGLRQALAAATRHPIIFAKDFASQFKYAFSNDAYEGMLQQVREHPNYDLMKRAKLAITDATHGAGATEREEAYVSGLAEKIPGIGRIVKGSDRAYSGLLTKMRVDIFNQLVDNAQRAGYDFSTIEGDRLLKQLGEVVNTSTGRGSLGKLEHSVQGLSTALFAPRLIASRLQMLNPQYYLKLQGPARKEALTTLMSLAAVAGTVLFVAKQAGAEVNTDPTNADFGKIKIGNTRMDVLGGYQQYIRLGAQLAEGKITSSITGAETKLDGSFGKPTRLEIIQRFLQNKESPVLSFATTLLQGTDATGNPINVKNEVVSRFIPLVAQDIADLYSHENAANPAYAAPLSVFGVGLQTYGTQDIALSKEQNKVLANVERTGTPEQVKAYKSYFQTSKLVSGKRTAANDKIDEAVKAGDYEKAVQLASDFNEEVKKTFKPWAGKYGDVATPELRKDYATLKINLDRNSLAQRRLNAIKKAKKGIIPR